ncbi:hypothetical protein N7925_06055 [Streptomyces sp. CA-278952]|uniref:hypothetical protein n=1 Tax=unclassified Streptomyces TaxID=2593676 RepID=UPI002241F942|nr:MULTISPECIES: hypothetical protein [unclassified Streptomyces]UZI27744.1 hypothetical protein OH133_06160 [Streptomyces sp. VB1]WDG27936.1 hypothetical protein N7925_06055 [Streptomyces sp. CA-278952]
MTTTLPVPIAFELPDGWRATPPDGVGAPGAAFVALHPHPDAGFTANITVDGTFRPDPATLPEIADESVANLRGSAASVDVAERREVGSEDAPGLTQTLAISAVAGGALRDLIQSQVYLSMLDVDDPSKRAVIRLILTVTAAQHGDVVEDFRDFVRTVRPDTGATS